MQTYIVHDICSPDIGLSGGIRSHKTSLGDFEEGRARCLGGGGVGDLGEVDDGGTVVVSTNGFGCAVTVSRLLVHLHWKSVSVTRETVLKLSLKDGPEIVEPAVTVQVEAAAMSPLTLQPTVDAVVPNQDVNTQGSMKDSNANIPTGLLLAGVRTQEFVDVVESVQIYWNVAWAFAVATRLARAAAAVANFMVQGGKRTELCSRQVNGAL